MLYSRIIITTLTSTPLLRRQGATPSARRSCIHLARETTFGVDKVIGTLAPIAKVPIPWLVGGRVDGGDAMSISDAVVTWRTLT